LLLGRKSEEIKVMQCHIVVLLHDFLETVFLLVAYSTNSVGSLKL